jgi:hypothetical protein
MLCHPECGVAAGETSGALDQNKGIQGVRLQSMLFHERSAKGRLQRRERKIAIGIALDDELD